MEIKIALAGNPNCGKTTLFNILTGSNQYVGNWPGVTVEKKEGQLKGNKDVIIMDLPGIYSLSPYTLEEVVARNYLVEQRPDAILNIVDGTNLERNLYLTTQLTELGIPVVVAINMMDLVRRNGDKINIDELSHNLGCKVVEISALKGTGVNEAAEEAIKAASSVKTVPRHSFSGEVEHALAHIEEAAVHSMPQEQQRWYAIKIFERDEKVLENLNINPTTLSHIEQDILIAEAELDDDAESIITNERYNYIASVLKGCYKKKSTSRNTISDKIDKVVTNRILAIPIFILVMFFVYALSIGTVGSWTVTFMNDGLFGSFKDLEPDFFGFSFLQRFYSIPELVDLMLLGADGNPTVAPWLYSLIQDGIIGGVGAVLGFVPQLFVLFLLLSILEDVGYMSRVAFIMDKLFRKFGLSGKSFIPMLVASGCGVPGVMASRTIEQERDRRMTIMTTCFIPCGAKMPIVLFIASSLFSGNSVVILSAYLIGIAAVVVSGILLKKTKAFSGKPAPFVMELPAYHMPTANNVFRATWERGWGFIKKAGTVIFAASVIIWTLNNISLNGGLHYITNDDKSILNIIGETVAVIFSPLGFGNWQSAVATILGLVAKEEVVGVFGVLGNDVFDGNQLAAFSFMVFNLLCAPCFAAMGAIKREMNSPKWTVAAIGYMTVFAYAVSFVVFQIGSLISTGVFTFMSALAILVLSTLVFLIVRKNKNLA